MLINKYNNKLNSSTDNNFDNGKIGADSASHRQNKIINNHLLERKRCPHVIDADLADLFHKTKALFLTQLIYWINRPTVGHVDENGVKWVHNSAKEWGKQVKCKERQMKNIIKDLQEAEIIYVKKDSRRAWYNMNCYTVNFEKLNRLIQENQKNNPINNNNKYTKQEFLESPSTQGTEREKVALQVGQSLHNSLHRLQSIKDISISSEGISSEEFLEKNLEEKGSIGQTVLKNDEPTQHPQRKKALRGYKKQKSQQKRSDYTQKRDCNYTPAPDTTHQQVIRKAYEIYKQVVENVGCLTKKLSTFLAAALKQLGGLEKFQEYCKKIKNNKWIQEKCQVFKENPLWVLLFRTIDAVLRGEIYDPLEKELEKELKKYKERRESMTPEEKEEEQKELEKERKLFYEKRQEIIDSNESEIIKQARFDILMEFGVNKYKNLFFEGCSISFEEIENGKVKMNHPDINDPWFKFFFPLERLNEIGVVI